MKLKPGHRYWTENERVKVIFSNEKNSKYRYLLECNWNDELDKVTFIMINPSVADFEICDPTLNRCVRFSKSWGFGGMKIVNLFALVSTDPRELLAHENPVGEENDHYILEAIKNSSQIILSWGESYGSLNNRAAVVKDLLSNYQLYCIKKTKNGRHPRHPLFLKADLQPILF